MFYSTTGRQGNPGRSLIHSYLSEMVNNSTSRQMGFLSQPFNLIIYVFQVFLPAFSIVMIALLNFLPSKSSSRRNLVRPLIFGLAFFLSILNAGKEHAGDLKLDHI